MIIVLCETGLTQRDKYLICLPYAVFVHWKYEEDHELEGKRFEARGKGEGKGIYDMKPEEGIVWRKKRNQAEDSQGCWGGQSGRSID